MTNNDETLAYLREVEARALGADMSFFTDEDRVLFEQLTGADVPRLVGLVRELLERERLTWGAHKVADQHRLDRMAERDHYRDIVRDLAESGGCRCAYMATFNVGDHMKLTAPFSVPAKR